MHTEGCGASPDTGFHEPSDPVGARFIISFAIAYFGFWITLLTPPIVALAVYLSTVLPESERNLLWCVARRRRGCVGPSVGGRARW